MPVTLERMEAILKDTLSALADSSDCVAAADLGILDSAIDMTEATVRTAEETGHLPGVVAEFAASRAVVVEWPNGKRFLLAIREL